MMLKELLLTFVLLDSIQTTVSAKYHGDECSENASCEVNTYCLLSVNNETRCLCPDGEYRSDRNQCVNIRTLVVEDVRTVKVTLNSVQLSWSSRNFNYVKAKYNVSYEDTYVVGDKSGVTIYYLKSETTYTFTIQVNLFKNTLYKARYGLPYIHSVRTNSNKKKSHGELCYKGVDSCPTELLCVQNKNQEGRCLCDNNHYWNDHNECISKSTLTIKTFTAKNIFSTSVELSWSIDPLHKSSAQFKVWYGDKNITFFNSDIMVATIDKLKPKTVYQISIKVEIPADKNYNLIEGPPSICIIRTILVDETSRQVPESTTLVFLISRGSELIQIKNVLTTTASELDISYGELCKLANLNCEPGTSCVETPNKQYRCLCNDLQYWNKDRLCVPLKGLTVTEVQVKKVTSTSVQLSWSNRNIDKLNAAYSVSFRNKSLAAHPGGINITNLQPARNYSFEIFVIIPIELNYKEKRGPGVSISAQTISVAEVKDPNLEKKTPTHQTTTLPTEIPSSSKQVLTHTTLANTASDSNSLILFLLVTVSLSLLLATSIVINIILMYKRRKRHTRNRQNVYHTTSECHQETHQYFDTTHLNQSHYDEVTDLALQHYIN